MLYQTHVRISRKALRENLANIRSAVGAQRKMLIAVKANAYGHGAVEVSKVAADCGVDWLGVATVPEAVELREAGIALPILKFSPAFPEEMEAAVRAGLALCVCERENIARLEAVVANLAKPVTGVPAQAVHLKIDTGMGRIGCTPEDAPALAAFIERECPHLSLQGVFTHLPVSDDDEPEFTRAQLDRFRACVRAVEQAIGRRPELVHCSNSGAVYNYDEGWLDMVRPGIMIYGLYTGVQTSGHAAIKTKPVLSFRTKVSFVKKVSAGTSIGYGRTWIAPRDSWIATIPAGYADGFNRLFSNRGRVLIGGKSYPLAGRVCMDQSMVDLGPETTVKPGDEVVLLGDSGDENITCAEWARLLGTITYEVTCQINQRVRRVCVD